LRKAFARRCFEAGCTVPETAGGTGHLTLLGRNYLTGRDGDRINAVLAAAGYNFSLLLRWFEQLLRVLSLILCHAVLATPASPNPVLQNFLHGRPKDEGRLHAGGPVCRR